MTLNNEQHIYDFLLFSIEKWKKWIYNVEDSIDIRLQHVPSLREAHAYTTCIIKQYPSEYGKHYAGLFSKIVLITFIYLHMPLCNQKGGSCVQHWICLHQTAFIPRLTQSKHIKIIYLFIFIRLRFINQNSVLLQNWFSSLMFCVIQQYW